MAEEHSDIFHCLNCGRIAYEPHGTSPPPACCGQPMVRAVADVVKDGPTLESGGTASGGSTSGETVSGEGAREADVEEYALLADAMELSHWSRSFPDTDVSRYEKLVERVAALAGAVADQFQNEERAGELAKAIGSDATHHAAAQRLREEERQLLSSFALFVDDLRQGAPRFRGWAEVCDRLDALASAFRRHETTESELLRQVIAEESARRN
jgi:hypothetical protein